MSQLITLTSDFATQDGFVGAMKGRILSLCADATVVDLSHAIPPQDIRAGAWCLRRAAPCFPPGTIHVAVVDPGVGSPRQPLLIRADEHYFIGPDNGLFSLVLEAYSVVECHALHRHTPWWQAHASFDGLALFSPAAACLARGEALAALASPINALVELPQPRADSVDGGLIGEIQMFDRFGNAITSITQADLQVLGTSVGIVCGERDFQLRDHYARAGKQRAVAIINSDGLLELALYSQSAREVFGLALGDRVRVRQVRQ